MHEKKPKRSRVRDNAVYNVAGALLPLGVTFVSLPYYLRAIGEERYGILAIFWMLLTYFNVFNAGLGLAATQQIARLKSDPGDERERVFWTALLLNLSLGAVGGAVLWASGGLLLDHLVRAPSRLVDEALSSLGLVALMVPVVTTGAVLSGTLQGLERFLGRNAVRILDSTLNQLLPLAAAYLFGPELEILIASVVVVRVISTGTAFWLCVRGLPIRKPFSFDLSLAPSMLKYGGWVSVTSVVSPLLSTLDRLVIGSLVGAKAVAYYTVPYSLAQRIGVLPRSLGSAMFPRFSAQGEAQRDALMAEGLRALASVVTPVVLAVVFAIKPFMTWWVGAEFADEAALPGQIIAVGIWFNSLGLVAFTRLRAEGRPDVVAKFHVAEVLPYLGFLWLAVTWWGIVGAGVAWSARVAVDAGLLLAAAGVSLATYGRLLVPVTLLASAMAVAVASDSEGLVFWLVEGIVTSCGLIWGWLTAPPVVKALITGLLGRGLPAKLRGRGPSQ